MGQTSNSWCLWLLLSALYVVRAHALHAFDLRPPRFILRHGLKGPTGRRTPGPADARALRPGLLRRHQHLLQDTRGAPCARADGARDSVPAVRHHQLFAKASKCQFGRSAVGFLGHVNSDRGVTVDQHKVAAADILHRRLPIRRPGASQLLSQVRAQLFLHRSADHGPLQSPRSVLARPNSGASTPSARSSHL